MGLLDPSLRDLELAAISAGRGETQLEREMGANVLLTAAVQAREGVEVLRKEVRRLSAVVNSVASVILEADVTNSVVAVPVQTSTNPASPPRLSIVRMAVDVNVDAFGVRTENAPPPPESA